MNKVDVTQEIGENFLTYALDTNVNKAFPNVYNTELTIVLYPAIIFEGGFITDNIYYYDTNCIPCTTYEQTFNFNGEQYYIPQGGGRYTCFKI